MTYELWSDDQFNAEAKLLEQDYLLLNDEFKGSIDISDLPKGIYFISFNNSSKTHKFIKA